MTAANRLLGAGALVCTLGLVGPAVAAAVPWEASPSGGSLSITGGDTMANKDFRVSVFGTGLRVTEYNGTAGSTSSGSCTYTDAVDDTVDCPAPGTSTIFAGLGPGNDQFDIVNTALPVLVFGNAGSDTIIGGLGADLLVGATGSDTLKGGAGDDLLTDGATFLFGDSGSGGNDVMQGQGDDDTLDAGFGSSALAAQTRAGGRDTLDGGNGLDVIDYSLRDAPLTITEADGVANDGESGEQDQVLSGERILGGSAADHIAGAAGGNVLEGRAGADLLEGGGGSDSLIGGAGDDVLDGGTGGDSLAGGPGTDTASYAARTAAVTVSFDDIADDGEAGELDDAGNDIENVSGGAGNDVLKGSGTGNGLTGGAGDDTISGNGGDDALDGGTGNDALDGGTGSDTLAGGAGSDTILARDDSPDTITCGTELDTVTADAQDNVAADCETVSRPPAAGGGGGGGGDPVVIVKDKDTTGPRLTIALFAKLTTTRSRVTVTVTCPAIEPAPCTTGQIALTFKRGKRTVNAGRLAFTSLKAGQKKALAVTVPKSARSLLKLVKRVTATATARDAAGNTGAASRTVTLRR